MIYILYKYIYIYIYYYISVIIRLKVGNLAFHYFYLLRHYRIRASCEVCKQYAGFSSIPGLL